MIDQKLFAETSASLVRSQEHQARSCLETGMGAVRRQVEISVQRVAFYGHHRAVGFQNDVLGR